MYIASLDAATMFPIYLLQQSHQQMAIHSSLQIHQDYLLEDTRASLVAQMAKHLPAVQETWVRSLGWKDPLEKEMAAQSSILA